MVNSREEMVFVDADKFLKDHCFSVIVNMNDTFMWGCADSESISTHDLDEAMRLEKKYGSAGLEAFVIAKRREYEPDFWYHSSIIGYCTKEHLDKVHKALEELENYETFPGMFKEYKRRFSD